MKTTPIAPSRCARACDAARTPLRTGMPATRAARAQRGLSIVEIMVAMAIGLFIVLIVATIWYLFLSTILTFIEHYIEHRLKDEGPMELTVILASLFKSKFWAVRRPTAVS